MQLGVYGIAGETKQVRVLVWDSDLDIKICEVVRAARYPRQFKEKWKQPGYWAPTSTLRLSNELDWVGEQEKRAFWVTLHADRNVKSGLHESTIWLMPENRPPTELNTQGQCPSVRAARGPRSVRCLFPPLLVTCPRQQ